MLHHGTADYTIADFRVRGRDVLVYYADGYDVKLYRARCRSRAEAKVLGATIGYLMVTWASHGIDGPTKAPA